MPRRTIARIARRHWPILIPIAFTLSVFHAWLEPGLLLGADWVRRVPGELNGYFPWPHVWNAAQQIGENDDSLMSYFPLFSAMGLLSRLHVSWNAIERIFFFFPYLVLSIASPYVFALRLTRSPLAAAVATCLWTVNTWIVMATERGAIPSIVAASILPLFFFYAIRFIERATVRRGLGLGLLLAAILLYDLRYVYIGLVFALILSVEQLIRDRSLARIRAATLPLCVAVITAIVANFYWIIPQFIEISSPGAGYASLPDYLLNSGYMTPQHALAGFAVFYHWVASNNPFASAEPEWYFFLIPIAVFLSFAVTWRKQWVWSLALGAAISVLLNCGPTFPVDKVNIWIFTHVPGMSLFRDVTKWMSLLYITYGTAIAFGLVRVMAFVRLKFGSARLPAARAAGIALTLVAAAAYVLIMNDSYNPERFRVFAPYDMHPDVLQLESYLDSRPNHLRSLIFPRDIEPMRAVISHPFVEGLQLENSASPDGLRHLNLEWDSLYGLFSSPFAPDFLRELNIGYFVIPYDYDKIVYSSYISNWTFYDALQFARTRPWLRFDRRIGRQYVFRVVDPMPARAFIAPAPFVLNGDSPAMASLVGTPFLTSKTAALMSNQPLAHIWTRVHNYIGGAWTVDTNLNGIATAKQIVRKGEAQNANAAAGRYRFIAAATSTASRKNNLYSGDDPISIETTFKLPRMGAAHFSANLTDLRPLSKTMFDTEHFAPAHTTIHYDPKDLIFQFGTHANERVVSLSYDRNHRAYAASIEFQNNNPIPLKADLSLAGIKAGTAYTAYFDGATTRCPQNCVFRDVRVAPGPQKITIRMPGAAGHKPTIKISDAIVLSNPVVPNIAKSVNGVTLVQGIDIRLDARPYMAFHYANTTDTLELFMRLRSRLDGREAWFADLLPAADIDLRQLQFVIGDGIHERFERRLAAHATDREWQYHDRLSQQPDGAGEYDITQIVVAGEHAIRFEPRRLTMLATPSWPSLASNDARQPTDARYPSSARVIEASGLKVAGDRPFEGYFGYTLRAHSKGFGQTVTFRLNIPASAVRNVYFDIFQPAGYSMQFNLSNTGKTLVQNVLGTNEGRAFDGGMIHVNEPNSVSWPIGEPHCLPDPCNAGAVALKSTGEWKSFSSDLFELEPHWNKRHTVTIELQRVAAGASPVEHFIVATRASDAVGGGILPGVLVDGSNLHYAHVTSDSENDTATFSGSLMLRNQAHRITSAPVFPQRPISLLISQGRLQSFSPATIQDDRRLNDEEYEGSIDSHGGLFVFDESYDRDWTLAITPAGFRPTGFALLDWLRTRDEALPAKDHYVVTDLLNGWWIPAGKLHVFALMKLEAFAQLAAMIWAVVSVGWIALVLLATRKQSA